MDDDSFEYQFPSVIYQQSFTSKYIIPSSTAHSERDFKVPKPKNYKQSRLNKKNNFQQLQSRIKQIETQIAHEKLKKEYCYRCGRSLLSKDCEVKHYQQNKKDSMQFQQLDLGKQIPKLKGQIWIAIGIIMLIIGYSLYGFKGQSPSINHFISLQEYQSISHQIQKEKSQTIKLSLILNSYEYPDEIVKQEAQVYAQSIITIIENSKEFTVFNPFSGW